MQGLPLEVVEVILHRIQEVTVQVLHTAIRPIQALAHPTAIHLQGVLAQVEATVVEVAEEALLPVAEVLVQAVAEVAQDKIKLRYSNKRA